MPEDRIAISGLSVEKTLHDVLVDAILPGTGIAPETFFTALARIVAEPRFDNQRLFRHLSSAGFDTVKEFDFPHKRSRLIMSQRHRFFSEVGL